MIGTLVNVLGILVGGVAGLLWRKGLSPARESMFRVLLGAFTVFYGLRLTWISLNGSSLQILKQLGIGVVSLMIGKLVGQLLGLQKWSNQIGQTTRERLATLPAKPRPGEGFKTCAALFCAAPLAILGPVQDGLSGYFYPLLVKGVMEGLATMGFIPLFGWGVMLAAIPVLAVQGTIAIGCKEFLEPMLQSRGLVESVNAVGGLLVFSVALVILELKRIELADYLPSLIVAPLLTWVLR